MLEKWTTGTNTKVSTLSYKKMEMNKMNTGKMVSVLSFNEIENLNKIDALKHRTNPKLNDSAALKITYDQFKK